MVKNRKAPRKVLAENLHMLMEAASYSGAKVARLAGVDPKTVTNMLNEKHNPDLDHVAAVAAVFKLSPWQIIRPDLRAEMQNSGALEQLIDNYYQASEAGKASIMQVAEMAAQYKAS